jgi:hypothetical protein
VPGMLRRGKSAARRPHRPSGAHRGKGRRNSVPKGAGERRMENEAGCTRCGPPRFIIGRCL